MPPLNKIKILIADNNELIREGVRAVAVKTRDIQVMGEASTGAELLINLKKYPVDVVLIDYSQPQFSVDDIRAARALLPSAELLALTEKCEKPAVSNALKAGLKGHILYCCDRNEITDAIRSVAKGEKFFCGKVLDVLNGQAMTSTCAPVSLSARETEIISLIADGLSNKQIADKLFLSTHTVITHRKNIMSKLGLNNTAGIVMYAVKENIINPNKYLFATEAE